MFSNIIYIKFFFLLKSKLLVIIIFCIFSFLTINFIFNNFKFSKNNYVKFLQLLILSAVLGFLLGLIEGLLLNITIYCDGTEDDDNQVEALTNNQIDGSTKDQNDYTSGVENVKDNHDNKGNNFIYKTLDTISTIRTFPLQVSTAISSYAIEQGLEVKKEIKRNNELLSKINESKESNKNIDSITNSSDDIIKSSLEIGDISPLENFNLLTDQSLLKSLLLILFLMCIFLNFFVNFKFFLNFINRFIPYKLKVWINNIKKG
uniref:Quinate/shikimate dehydrogenase n=1 Tax=Phallus echinovolvatus TaxID=2201239 RepID=A0A7D5J6V0_9AGAM|nr:quinate/shikimate dehydrogenase [Phallus echinovolvatus]QLD96662.1 quinate/shikimate dehydrogenase [Phallus echinovolvatus]